MVQALDLSNNTIAADGAKELLQPPLGSGGSTSGGAAAGGDGADGGDMFADAPPPPLPSLTSLSLAGNRLGDAGCRVLAPRLGLLSSLRSLDLNCNGIGNSGARALAAHLCAVSPANPPLPPCPPAASVSVTLSGQSVGLRRIQRASTRGPIRHAWVFTHRDCIDRDVYPLLPPHSS